MYEALKDLVVHGCTSTRAEQALAKAEGKMLIRYNRCLRCGHEWQSEGRGTDIIIPPNICPHCKSKRWNELRRKRVVPSQ